MWPLSERATGSLQFGWDPGQHCAMVTDHSGTKAAVLGSSHPLREHVIGQFGDIEIKEDHLVGVPTDDVQVCIGMRLALTAKVKQCAFVFSGSGFTEHEALRTFRIAIKGIPRLFAEKVRHYKRLLNTTLQLETPDDELNRSLKWAVVGTDKFFAETPGLGSSFLAGHGLSSSGWNGGQTNSGRPGYAWYFGRDSAWTCLAAIDYGDLDKVRTVLEFLGRHQDLNGKILHELTTSGHAHFDAADSTPLYLIAFGRYLRASGDVSFARKEFPRLTKALDYCFSADTDGDHLIENSSAGHGWIEGGKLFPAFAEHYLSSCWAEALTQVSYVAGVLNKHRLASRCMREGNIVRSILKRTFQNEATGFYSFAKNPDGSFRPEITVLPTVGMYFDCAEDEFARHSLSEFASDRFTADWGVRIVRKDDFLFDPTGYHYGSIWPLFTGWTSLAEYHLNRPLQGFGHLMSNALLVDQFSAGGVDEVLHGEQFRPAGVCPHQAWSGSMIMQPAIEGLLGLKVDALSCSLGLKPSLPPQWKEIRVRNIRVGQQRVAMSVRRSSGETVFTFSAASRQTTKRSRSVQIQLQPTLPLGTRIEEIWLAGKQIAGHVHVDKDTSIPILHGILKSSLHIRIKHSYGISVVPPRPHFEGGEESRGLRIVDERWELRVYSVIVEGKIGSEYLLDVFDPARTAKKIDGAVAVAREGEYLILSVVFSGESLSGYSRKELRLTT
jgi:glycogen debranching enzyme